MRGVAQSQNQVSASSSPRYTYQDLFKSHGGHGLFDDVDIGKLKKSTTGGKGVKTESFTSDGYVFQFLNYGQVCSDKPIAVVGLTINTCLSDESGNSYIYTCNPTFASKTKYTGSSNCYGTSQTTDFPLGCTTEFNDDDYAGEDYLSLYVGCSNGDSTEQIPDGTEYAINTYFGDNQCSGAMAYKGLVNDFCVFTGDNSYRVLFPNITYYVGSNNCNASPPLATATSNQQYFKQSCGPSIAHTFDDDNMPDFSFENGKVMTGSFSISGTNHNNDDSGPSDGAIAGVVIGCVVGIGLLFGLLFWCVFFRKASTGLADQQKN